MRIDPIELSLVTARVAYTTDQKRLVSAWERWFAEWEESPPRARASNGEFAYFGSAVH